MCRRSIEIQQRWAQAYGDFFVSGDGKISCWIKKDTHGLRVKRGFGIQREGRLIRLSRCIWLPRLAQLIEMAQQPGRRYDSVTMDFFNWVKAPYGENQASPSKQFSSTEQLWLAFIMETRYRKKWNGIDWTATG